MGSLEQTASTATLGVGIGTQIVAGGSTLQFRQTQSRDKILRKK